MRLFATGLTRSRNAVAASLTPTSAPVDAGPVTEVAPSLPSNPKPRFDPLQDDEVAAFKKALASVPVKADLKPTGVEQSSGRRNLLPEPPQFKDTEIDEPPSPLGRTQYGELN